GAEIAVEGKGSGVPPPSRQGMPRGCLMSGGNCYKRRRSRTAIQIFVGAADRKIDFVPVECNFNHPGGMTEIPYDQRASLVNAFGSGGDVEQRARAIVHLRKHDDRD